MMEKGEPKNRLNEISGKNWTRYSISVWDIIKTFEERKAGHPAMFPLELCKRLIEIYTKKGDTVLDPMMGKEKELALM
jgi:DNA modification methylase